MSRKIALLQIHSVAVLFGLTGLLGRYLSSDAWVLVLGRAGFAILAMSVLLLSARCLPWQGLALKRIGLLFLMGGLLAGHWVTFFVGVKTGGVAVGTLGFASFPAFTLILESCWRRQWPSSRHMLLVCLVSIGLILVVPRFDFQESATAGVLWGMLSALLYALLALINRHAIQYITAVQICWWQYLMVILLTLPFAVAQLSSIPASDWMGIAVLGLFCTGLAYSLYVNSLKVLNAGVAAMVIALEPVYAILMAWVWLAEAPTLRMLAGGALIILSVLWIGRRGKG